MIVFGLYRLSVSTLPVASIWNTYSLPIRRAGSPVHDSSWPKTAYLTPAAFKQVTTARATRRLRSSNEAAQPTQYRHSSSLTASAPPCSTTWAAVGTSRGSDLAQSSRDDCGWPQMLE